MYVQKEHHSVQREISASLIFSVPKKLKIEDVCCSERSEIISEEAPHGVGKILKSTRFGGSEKKRSTVCHRHRTTLIEKKKPKTTV